MVKHYFKHYAHFSKDCPVILCFEEPWISKNFARCALLWPQERPKALFPLTEIVF